MIFYVRDREAVNKHNFDTADSMILILKEVLKNIWTVMGVQCYKVNFSSLIE